MPNGREILDALVLLREEMQMGFRLLDGRLVMLETRFDSLETRFDRFQRLTMERFDAIDVRFDGIDRRLHLLEIRIARS